MRDKTLNKHRAKEEVNSSLFYLTRYIRDLGDDSREISDRRVRYLAYTRSALNSAINYLSYIA
jgi:hypothetical protein